MGTKERKGVRVRGGDSAETHWVWTQVFPRIQGLVPVHLQQQREVQMVNPSELSWTSLRKS